jgi:hypothetical protein
VDCEESTNLDKELGKSLPAEVTVTRSVLFGFCVPVVGKDIIANWDGH